MVGSVKITFIPTQWNKKSGGTWILRYGCKELAHRQYADLDKGQAWRRQGPEFLPANQMRMVVSPTQNVPNKGASGLGNEKIPLWE